MYVASLLWSNLLTTEAARVLVPGAWTGAEWPLRHMTRDDWRELWDVCGYVVDGEPAERPTEPLRLWRGSLPGKRYGWSWTDDRDLARWFADRTHNEGRGLVYVADVEPARLLARIITSQRLGEPEYVVDARKMKVLADSLRTRGVL